MTLTVITIFDQSEPGSNGNKEAMHISQISSPAGNTINIFSVTGIW